MAGIAKGRTLVAPKGDLTRPTSDFVREAIFNSLIAYTSLEGAVVDLFAGTGALGIEALSRGAAHATFIERDKRAIAAIRDNLVRTGFEQKSSVIQGDVERTDLPPAEVVFADPPYVWDGWNELLARLETDVAVIESDREIDLGDGWRVLRVKRYGTTVVSLASPEELP